jgi:hypothetical protein
VVAAFDFAYVGSPQAARGSELRSREPFFCSEQADSLTQFFEKLFWWFGDESGTVDSGSSARAAHAGCDHPALGRPSLYFHFAKS